MHSFEHSSGGLQPVNTTITYHSDLSGFATIKVENRGKVESLNVPAPALLEFVADHIRNQKIAALEQMKTADLLKSLIK